MRAALVLILVLCSGCASTLSVSSDVRPASIAETSVRVEYRANF